MVRDLRRQIPMRWVLLGFVASLLVLFRLHDRLSVRSLRITFFDVGQGDSALVRFPGGKTMLIDSGGGIGDWNLGKRELFLELARMGILTLDQAVLSHPDQDHGLGFLGLFEHLKIREFLYNEAFLKDEKPRLLLQKLLAAAQGAGTKVEGVEGEIRRNEFGVAIRFLTPTIKRIQTNDRSLMVHLEYAGCSFLFTGDIEADGEFWLAQQLRSPITVLKVAHHGSKTSSTQRFLERVRPKISVISNGYYNHYGHPNPDAMRRLRRVRTKILRTDFHGFVTMEVNREGTLRCQTATGSCGELRCH